MLQNFLRIHLEDERAPSVITCLRCKLSSIQPKRRSIPIKHTAKHRKKKKMGNLSRFKLHHSNLIGRFRRLSHHSSMVQLISILTLLLAFVSESSKIFIDGSHDYECKFSLILLLRLTAKHCENSMIWLRAQLG